MKKVIATFCALFFILISFSQTINTGSVSSSLCAGSMVSVPYTKTGTFVNGNVFTAQLSNSNGLFTTPVNIGSVTSVNSGTINAVIPINTLSGSAYRIRVVSSSPSIIGVRNSNGNLTVTTPVIPEVTIVSNVIGQNLPCSGSLITYNATATNVGTTPTYSWRVNGQEVGSNSNIYSSSTLQHLDSISCIVTTTTGFCAVSSRDTSNYIIQQLGSANNLGWRRKKDLFNPGQDHSISFSINEKGYLGGSSGSTSLWEYNPSNDTWIQKNPMPATLDKSFTIGNKAYAGNSSGFWSYDPVVDQWTPKSSFPGGTILICFSIQNKGYALSNNYFGEYDPVSDTWTSKAYPPYPSIPEAVSFNRNGGFGFSIGNKGYIGSGSYYVYELRGSQCYYQDNELVDFWEYDSRENSWVSKPIFQGSFHGIAFSLGDKGYVGTGDFNYCGWGWYGCQVASNKISQFNPNNNEWIDVDFPGSGRQLADVFTIKNTAYVMGGRDYYDTYGDMGIYSVDTIYSDMWQMSNSMYFDSLPNSFCPGQTFNVNLRTNCLTFNQGNTFTFQLSDIKGGFSNPMTLGTSSSAGNFSISLPTSVSYGDSYQIRAVSSLPKYEGLPMKLNINPVLYSNSISGISNSFGCNSDSLLTYSVLQVPNAVYTWSVTGTGNLIAQGQGTSTVKVKLINAGQIKVIAQLVSECGNSGFTATKDIARSTIIAPSVIRKSFNPDKEADVFVNDYFISTVNQTQVYDTFRIRSVANAKDYVWEVPNSSIMKRVNDTTIAVAFDNNLVVTPQSPKYIRVFSINECASSTPFSLLLKRRLDAVPSTIDKVICRGSVVQLSASFDSLNEMRDIDGRIYPVSQIGNQLWTSKNLDRNTNESQYINNDSLGYSEFGRLYNSYENINDFAPDGWHIPTIEDAEQLKTFLGPNAGGKLKATGFQYWSSPNLGATNEFGFNARGAGTSVYYDTAYPGDFKLDCDILLNKLFEITHPECPLISMGYTPYVMNFNSYSDALQIFYRPYPMYNFSIRFIRNQPGLSYQWSNGATTRNITVSPTATTSYYCTVSDGKGYYIDTFKVTVLTGVPSAPVKINGSVDVCPSIVGSSQSSPLIYTVNKVANASSYVWTMPTGATLVSGLGDTSISVIFSNSFTSGTISVKAVNECGQSASRTLVVYKRVVTQPATIQNNFSPSIPALTSVCGVNSSIYKIRKVAYATSYVWTLKRGNAAQIVSMNTFGINDTAVIVYFGSSFSKDTLIVRAVNSCSISSERILALSSVFSPPAISSLTGNTSPCTGSTAVYSATASSPTSTQSTIKYFRWTRPNGTSIISASVDSSSITVLFQSGYTGGSIVVRGQSSCGILGTTRSLTLRHFPPTPTSIISSTGNFNPCFNSVVTYTAVVPAITVSQANAVKYRWTIPTGTTIVSSTSDSLSIGLQINTGYRGGALTVRGITACGVLGTLRSQSLTYNACKTALFSKNEINSNADSKITIFPNPSNEKFEIFSLPKEAIYLKLNLRDAAGRLLLQNQFKSGDKYEFGSSLMPGFYWLEVYQQEKKHLFKLIKN